MCDSCLRHGTAGKWYFNARHYSKELAEELDLKEFLMEQYKSFESMQVRKFSGFNAVGLGYTLRIPLIGRIAKYTAEKMLHTKKPSHNPFKAEGHIGQVVPLDDAIAILENCVDEDSIILKYCMCRYMHKGEKEACCINFGIMSEIIDKLPRFIPEDDKYKLTKEEAIEKFTEFNKKGYIGTIWYGAYPYINNLCACDNPACAGFKPRLNFDIKSIFKAEYVAQIDENNCQGCKSCLTMCKFAAISFDQKQKISQVDQTKCWGCGNCLHVCKYQAIGLESRKEIPAIAYNY